MFFFQKTFFEKFEILFIDILTIRDDSGRFGSMGRVEPIRIDLGRFGTIRVDSGRYLGII